MLELATKNGAAVVMARIVDGAGVAIRPSSVAGIDFSLFAFDGRGRQRPVAGQIAVPLDADLVMFDSLQAGGLWSVDVCGYNFRHELEFAPVPRMSRLAQRYLAQYDFTSANGERSMIHFHVNGSKR